MLAFQLFVQGDNLGALSLYGDDVNVFDEESEQVGLLVAAHTAVSFSDHLTLSGEILARHRNQTLMGNCLDLELITRVLRNSGD